MALTLTTPSLLPVMMTLRESHSIMVDMATQLICWFRAVAVLMLAISLPLMLHTCRYVPAHVAMSPYITRVHNQTCSYISQFPNTCTYIRDHQRPYTTPLLHNTMCS